VLVQDFSVVDRPFEDIARCLDLRGGPDALLSSALQGAFAEGESLRAKVGPEGWPAVLSKTVRIRSGPPRRHGDGLIVPFCWSASDEASLFSRLDADLEIGPLGPRQSQLVIRARYEPPGGAIGRGVDRVLLHRLAESTLRAFLTGICAAVQRSANDHAARPGPVGSRSAGRRASGARAGAAGLTALPNLGAWSQNRYEEVPR
jgi:hypothetical protein